MVEFGDGRLFLTVKKVIQPLVECANIQEEGKNVVIHIQIV